MQVTLTVNTESNDEIREAQDLLGRMLKTEASADTPSKPVEDKKPATKVKAKVTPKKEAEKPAEPKEETKDATEEMTLEALKAIAKDALVKSDRETVKATINKFGAKLAEVDARMYGDLATALKAL